MNSSNWNPQVIKVQKIEKHGNADNLEVIHYAINIPVVVKKGEFRVGDLAMYIPIDTVVPSTPTFEFLGDDRVVKAKRLRGQYSQGLLLPVDTASTLKEGDCLINFLGLSKVDEEVHFRLKKQYDAEVPPRVDMPNFNVPGIHKVEWVEPYASNVIATEKLHGSFTAITWHNGRLYVKSKNIWLREKEGNPWWEAARKFDENIFKSNSNLFFLGEMVGLQKGFPYGKPKMQGIPRIVFFDVWEKSTLSYPTYEDTTLILNGLGIPKTPIIPIETDIYDSAEGRTSYEGSHIREGLVLYRKQSKGSDRHICKVISRAYNLSKYKSVPKT